MDDEHEEIVLTPGALRAIEAGNDLLEVRFKVVEHAKDSITLEGNVEFWVEVAEALFQASLTDPEGEALYDAFCEATCLERVDPDDADDL